MSPVSQRLGCALIVVEKCRRCKIPRPAAFGSSIHLTALGFVGYSVWTTPVRQSVGGVQQKVDQQEKIDKTETWRARPQNLSVWEVFVSVRH
jgi:hypothetical protein